MKFTRRKRFLVATKTAPGSMKMAVEIAKFLPLPSRQSRTFRPKNALSVPDWRMIRDGRRKALAANYEMDLQMMASREFLQ